MTTIADELLNDFESDGSEAEDENGEGGLFQDDPQGVPEANAIRGPRDPAAEKPIMELDDDEEPIEDEDMEDEPTRPGVEAEDEEEAKARVEKMQLAQVSDVRSVAGLMKTLEPILEVSNGPIAYTLV